MALLAKHMAREARPRSLNIWPARYRGGDPRDHDVPVTCAPGEKFGQTPTAIVHARREMAPTQIVSHCNARLANYKVPRFVVI
ncbi:MAG: hypothetical protein ACSLE1_18185 [Sphingobium sp.]